MDEKEKTLLKSGIVAYFNIEICPGSRDVWDLLRAHSANRITTVSIDQLRIDSGFSSAKVAKCVKKLKQNGLLKILTPPGEVGRYLLLEWSEKDFGFKEGIELMEEVSQRNVILKNDAEREFLYGSWKTLTGKTLQNFTDLVIPFRGIYVFILLKPKKTCLYVGRSKDVLGRVRTHFQGRFGEKFARRPLIVKVRRNKVKYEDLTLEAKLICKLNPKYNIVKVL